MKCIVAILFLAWCPSIFAQEEPPPSKPSEIDGIRIRSEYRAEYYNRKNHYTGYQSKEQAIAAQIGGMFSPYTLHCFPSLSGTQGSDIEHIVAAEEAHDSGLSERPIDERKTFASDLNNLTLAKPYVNRYLKKAKNPAQWMPDNNRCWFVNQVVKVKRKYSLYMDQQEYNVVKRVLDSCESFEMEKPDCN